MIMSSSIDRRKRWLALFTSALYLQLVLGYSACCPS
jgi:hypothetical protein